MTALSTLLTLLQSAGSIHFWPRRNKDPLDGISARQLISVLKELGGDPANLLKVDRAHHEIRIEPTSEERLVMQVEYEPLEVPPMHVVIDKVSNSGDIITRGRQIIYIRDYPDGTRDVILMDG